jgi:hypothetical protein
MAPGWVLKPNVRGHESKLYILDFFGSSKLRGKSLHLDPRRILTAFKSPWQNSFLGYYISSKRLDILAKVGDKLKQGIIWGKDPKYYEGHDALLKRVASKAPLVSTATRTMFEHPNVKWVGHQSGEQWLELLAKSRFLLGMGHPLLGPSAVDAISLGCMFINPIYKEPQLEARYASQHPYIAEIAPEYVCSYPEDEMEGLLHCVDRALSTTLKPFIPPELTKEGYLRRVKAIFEL